MVPNIQVESNPTPLLTVDEVEKIQRQKIASLIGHVFQLSYSALIDTNIHDINSVQLSWRLNSSVKQQNSLLWLCLLQ